MQTHTYFPSPSMQYFPYHPDLPWEVSCRQALRLWKSTLEEDAAQESADAIGYDSRSDEDDISDDDTSDVDTLDVDTSDDNTSDDDDASDEDSSLNEDDSSDDDKPLAQYYTYVHSYTIRPPGRQARPAGNRG